MKKKSSSVVKTASVGNDRCSARSSGASGSQVENVTLQAGAAVEDREARLGEEIGCDERLEKTILWRRVIVNTEFLYRQNGQFFLHKQESASLGQSAWVGSCELWDTKWRRLSPVEAEDWLEYNSFPMDRLDEQTAELDNPDGVGKRTRIGQAGWTEALLTDPQSAPNNDHGNSEYD